MKKTMIMAGLLACMGITAQAQDAKTDEPKGKAIVQVFGNFHTGFGQGQEAIFVHQQISTLFQQTHSPADTGLGISHGLCYINAPNGRLLLRELIYSF